MGIPSRCCCCQCGLYPSDDADAPATITANTYTHSYYPCTVYNFYSDPLQNPNYPTSPLCYRPILGAEYSSVTLTKDADVFAAETVWNGPASDSFTPSHQPVMAGNTTWENMTHEPVCVRKWSNYTDVSAGNVTRIYKATAGNQCGAPFNPSTWVTGMKWIDVYIYTMKDRAGVSGAPLSESGCSTWIYMKACMVLDADPTMYPSIYNFATKIWDGPGFNFADAQANAGGFFRLSYYPGIDYYIEHRISGDAYGFDVAGGYFAKRAYIGLYPFNYTILGQINRYYMPWFVPISVNGSVQIDLTFNF